ncbi:hypothetical protein OEZ71_00380 [Defluviimonas sp. WL0050]|uniref:Uncharacterized protein n=2 Tax=Albidovulum litorale TaxID=2984134 RepID=A0ABT2ZHY0_9RHOB|nr:hypothetical protein [Defluviimonas sp. WL0050]
MKVFSLVWAMAFTLPFSVSASEIAFDCRIENAGPPEMNVRLTQPEDASVGTIVFADQRLEALIYDGDDSKTFLFLGDDYSLNYTVNTSTGGYEFFADGSRAAEGTGICVTVSEPTLSADGSSMGS